MSSFSGPCQLIEAFFKTKFVQSLGTAVLAAFYHENSTESANIRSKLQNCTFKNQDINKFEQIKDSLYSRKRSDLPRIGAPSYSSTRKFYKSISNGFFKANSKFTYFN
jgi:hypothetical protein